MFCPISLQSIGPIPLLPPRNIPWRAVISAICHTGVLTPGVSPPHVATDARGIPCGLHSRRRQNLYQPAGFSLRDFLSRGWRDTERRQGAPPLRRKVTGEVACDVEGAIDQASPLMPPRWQVQPTSHPCGLRAAGCTHSQPPGAGGGKALAEGHGKRGFMLPILAEQKYSRTDTYTNSDTSLIIHLNDAFPTAAAPYLNPAAPGTGINTDNRLKEMIWVQTTLH